MVGVITVVADKIESPEEVKHNIASALKYVERERFIACSNCGMAPLPKQIAINKIKALGLGTRLANQK
jgi:5-methyltetrahydropteroyltriglutamate--homocysteine methyltransferase